MKRFVEGDDRRQVTLLPACLDGCVAPDNPVRIVDVFVDELDLAALGFAGIVPEVTGCPSYHPATFFKIYIYVPKVCVWVIMPCSMHSVVWIARLFFERPAFAREKVPDPVEAEDHGCARQADVEHPDGRGADPEEADEFARAEKSFLQFLRECCAIRERIGERQGRGVEVEGLPGHGKRLGRIGLLDPPLGIGCDMRERGAMKSRGFSRVAEQRRAGSQEDRETR
jgi:hypothetical protein